jgi:hypothetical protein
VNRRADDGRPRGGWKVPRGGDRLRADRHPGVDRARQPSDGYLPAAHPAERPRQPRPPADPSVARGCGDAVGVGLGWGSAQLRRELLALRRRCRRHPQVVADADGVCAGAAAGRRVQVAAPMAPASRPPLERRVRRSRRLRLWRPLSEAGVAAVAGGSVGGVCSRPARVGQPWLPSMRRHRLRQVGLRPPPPAYPPPSQRQDAADADGVACGAGAAVAPIAPPQASRSRLRLRPAAPRLLAEPSRIPSWDRWCRLQSGPGPQISRLDWLWTDSTARPKPREASPWKRDVSAVRRHPVSALEKRVSALPAAILATHPRVTCADTASQPPSRRAQTSV